MSNMESAQRVHLYVTFVEKEGPFLKLWGQTDKNNAIYVEQFLAGIAPQFDAGVGKIIPEHVPPGTLIYAKYKDNKYYRAKILNNIFVREGFLEVSFIDYGNKEIVAAGAIRSLQNLSSIINIPPLAVGFIFAEAHCVGGGEWNDTVFENIAKEVKYREVQCTLLTQATQYYLVRISVEGTDLCNVLIQRGLMQPISLQAQQAVLLSMSMQKQSTTQNQQAAAPSSGINTYKACTLEPGCQYPVYVSYVNDGPCHFSVQLKQTEDVLVMLMNDINSIALRLLDDVPIPGTICLARCQEDGNVCRAVVTNEVDTQFKVFYVDFGNYEQLPMDSLYQIPFKYVLPKVMAIRFSLAGIEKPSVTINMQIAFKKFVDNRLLHMKVLPSATRTALPKCELWDPETKTSALDVVIRAAKHSYPEPMSLQRGFSQPVKVSFVYSCNRFFVQLVNKETELSTLMDDLQGICQTSEFMDPTSLKDGIPCCALFSGDQLWYRSQVVQIIEDSVKVRYIDFGNEEVVPITQLKSIDGEILTVLRPQAMECCLNGYQNMEPEEERDGLLEELILEGTFTMKVVDMYNKKALVELFDSSNYNVASLLLDKLAAAKSQISPVLVVQAGNKIEHRKSYSQQREQNFKGDRNHNTGRENKSWDKSNDRNDRNEKSWRQENRENRNYDKNTNDNNENNSWRQNNKGFSPKSRIEKHNTQEDSWNTNKNTENNNSDWDATKKTQTIVEDNWNDTSNTTQDIWNTGTETNNWGAPSTDDRPKRNDYRGEGRFGDKGRGGYNKDRGERGDRGDRGGYNNDRDDRGGYKSDRGGFKSDRKGFDSNRGGFNERGDKFGGKSRDGGYKQRDFKKDGSEMSSSGSEKSFHKGPRTSSRADRGGRGGGRTYDKSSSFNSRGGGDAWENNTAEDSWNVSAVTPSIDAAPVSATFASYDVVGTEAKIVITWFHNPALFYCQQLDFQEQFKTMMQEIHDFYKDRKPERVVQGAPVVGLFPEDNVLYRARVLEVIGTEYKVHYVDFGNVSTISKVWPIEKKFMNLPAQAIPCSLNSIAPVGEEWGDPDRYSSYFDKDSFDCQFINKDEDINYVNIFNNSEDVAQLLLTDGLILSTASTVPDIEIPLLVGQQFRAVIKSVNNLSDIIAALECGLAVSCTMHNLDSATETFEETLKGLLEQAVIIYVDNVLEDYRLEITLYDTEGNKHVILNPDEGAYETVDVPCPILVLRSAITGYVPFADETSVFIQPVEYADHISVLLDKLFEAYDGKPNENTIIPEEGSIYAVHSEDGNWYRGKVISFDDETVSVFYVDYGNSENVAFGELRELEIQFLDISILSLQVTIPSDSNTFIDKDVIANVFYGEAGWEGTIQIYDSSATQVLSKGGESYESTDTGFASSSINKPEEEEEDGIMVAGGEIERKDVDTTKKLLKGSAVVISHIDTPSQFYLQLSKHLGDIDNLQAELQESIGESEVLENPVAGTICAASYSADQQWYRAEILEVDDDIITVRFIDFGNTDVIDNKATQIKTLSPKLLSLAMYATKCSLQVEPTEEEWSSLALGVFENLVGGENIVAEFFDENEMCKYVDLDVDGVNIREALLKENLARPISKVTETELQKGTAVTISHIDTPTDFYVQFSENLADIDNLQAELQESVKEMEVLDNPVAGALCAAPYSIDQQWYRAEVLDADEDITTVRFVDFGNTDVIDNKTTQVKTLSPKLLSLAIYATRCSLQVEPLEEEWSSLALGVFENLVGGDNVVAEFFNQDEKCTYVDLYVDGVNIREALLKDNLAKPISKVTEAKQTGFVSHLNSPSEFWIQLENCIDELEWIAEQLNAAASFPELIDLTPGTLCAALFPDDQMWYRARILSNTVAGVELLFVDYGNSCTSADLRQLPEDLIMTAPLAMKCSLQKNEGIPTWSPEAAAKFEKISADGQTIFTVKKISTGETSIVQLLLDGKDVTTMLLPTTEGGFVKEIETLEKLSIEKESGEKIEEVALEAMEGQEFDENAKEKLEEINEKGTTLFQIEFVNEERIRLYLDGKDIRPLLGGFRDSLYDPYTRERNITDVDDQNKNIDTVNIEPGTSSVIDETSPVQDKDVKADIDTMKEIDDVQEIVDKKIDIFKKDIEDKQDELQPEQVDKADKNMEVAKQQINSYSDVTSESNIPSLGESVPSLEKITNVSTEEHETYASVDHIEEASAVENITQDKKEDLDDSNNDDHTHIFKKDIEDKQDELQPEQVDKADKNMEVAKQQINSYSDVTSESNIPSLDESVPSLEKITNVSTEEHETYASVDHIEEASAVENITQDKKEDLDDSNNDDHTHQNETLLEDSVKDTVITSPEIDRTVSENISEIISDTSSVIYKSLVNELVSYTEKIKVETKDIVSKGEPAIEQQGSTVNEQLSILENSGESNQPTKIIENINEDKNEADFLIEDCVMKTDMLKKTSDEEEIVKKIESVEETLNDPVKEAILSDSPEPLNNFIEVTESSDLDNHKEKNLNEETANDSIKEMAHSDEESFKEHVNSALGDPSAAEDVKDFIKESILSNIVDLRDNLKDENCPVEKIVVSDVVDVNEETSDTNVELIKDSPEKIAHSDKKSINEHVNNALGDSSAAEDVKDLIKEIILSKIVDISDDLKEENCPVEKTVISEVGDVDEKTSDTNTEVLNDSLEKPVSSNISRASREVSTEKTPILDVDSTGGEISTNDAESIHDDLIKKTVISNECSTSEATLVNDVETVNDSIEENVTSHISDTGEETSSNGIETVSSSTEATLTVDKDAPVEDKEKGKGNSSLTKANKTVSAEKTSISNKKDTSPNNKNTSLKTKQTTPTKVQDKIPIKASKDVAKDAPKLTAKKSPTSQSVSTTKSSVQRTSLCLPKDLSSKKDIAKKEPSSSLVKSASKSSLTSTSPAKSDSKLNPKKTPTKSEASTSALKTDSKLNPKKVSPGKPDSLSSSKQPAKSDAKATSKSPNKDNVCAKPETLVGNVLKDIVDLACPKDDNQPQESPLTEATGSFNLSDERKK